LIPTLDSSADGTGDNGEIEGSRLAPFVENLIADIFDFQGGEGVFSVDVLVVGGVLSYESTLADKSCVLSEPFLFSESIDLLEKGVPGN
jgi:hypothetical protein